MNTFRSTKQILMFAFVFFLKPVFSQRTYYGDEPLNWSDRKPLKLPLTLQNYAGSDLVIINDQVEFYFYGSNNEKVMRYLTFKINTEKGLEQFNEYRFPESFDPAFDNHLTKQGRGTRIKVPLTMEYTIKRLGARKFSQNKWSDVPFKLRYEKTRWMRASGDDAGEFADEDYPVFQFQNIGVGDVVELFYEATFNSNYGNNLFYFNARYPKLQCEYTFNYKMDRRFEATSFILPVNIKDTCISKNIEIGKDYSIVTRKIRIDSLTGINYVANCFPGKKLPYVYADFRFYRTLLGSYPSDGHRVYDFGYFRPRNFEWVVLMDTVNDYTKVYDKQFASIRKFMNKMPPAFGADSTNTTFFKALCDTFNNFRYISSNHLFYNESNLRDVYSGDHLLKRRLVQHLQWKLYRDLLNEGKIFYYLVNVQDKRLGEHTTAYRACYAYERNLIALPAKDSYIYFMPRYQGMKYHLNELPFYLEGTLAALTPRNFQDYVKNKNEKMIFIRTHRGTFNENTRSENASVKIALDSLKADFVIKESLSGQFSTVLRHLYLGEYIDSTISKHYFKKCVDKPLAFESKIKLSSKMTDFPFRYNFSCSEKMALTSRRNLQFKNWFSFVLSKAILPEKPSHDYYFDFDFTDNYNFMLSFNAPVVLKNASAFAKKIDNNYFEFESSIQQQSETAYLVKVKMVVKQNYIPERDMDLLMQLIVELEEINNFSLEFGSE